MRNFLIPYILFSFISLKVAYTQQVYKLAIVQPPSLSYTISEELFLNQGEFVYLDTLYQVINDILYTREWSFYYNGQIQSVDNPTFELTTAGILYLTLIDEYGCTTIDSVTINLMTNIQDDFVGGSAPYIKVFPNPNFGSFTVEMVNCTSGYTIEIVNSLGVQILSKELDYSSKKHNTTIDIPESKPGIYFLFLKKGKKLIYKEKLIVHQ